MEQHDPPIHMIDCPHWLTRFEESPEACDCDAGEDYE